jgi:arsenate reductase (thioredoxin)
MNVEISPLLRRCLNASIAELSTEFRGVFSRETVARYLKDSVEQIGERPTIGPNFLPVIIERFARERLWAVAHAEQRMEKGIPEVLFVCEHNAGRSQIAATLTHHLSNGWVGVRSAGAHPDEQIDPIVVQAMTEIGVDVALEFPKPLTDEVVLASDVVVTLGCGDACAVYPGKRYQDWPVPDPAGQPLAVVRQVRYDLYHHVWERLGTAGDARPDRRPPRPAPSDRRPAVTCVPADALVHGG